MWRRRGVCGIGAETTGDLLATLYQALDVPLETHYEDASGRPVSIVAGGRPVRELF